MNISAKIKRLNGFQYRKLRYFTIHFENNEVNADVQALPKRLKQMEASDIVVENLRLYCLVLNEHVVFLFNGGIRTTDNAKDCPNVGPYIKQANELVRKIDELLINKEISWNKDLTEIDFDENMEIEL